MLDQITTWMGEHNTTTILLGTVIYEIVGRLVPTEKRASIFSWTGKLLKGIGDVSFLISDILSKVVVDKKLPKSK